MYVSTSTNNAMCCSTRARDSIKNYIFGPRNSTIQSISCISGPGRSGPGRSSSGHVIYWHGNGRTYPRPLKMKYCMPVDGNRFAGGREDQAGNVQFSSIDVPVTRERPTPHKEMRYRLTVPWFWGVVGAKKAESLFFTFCLLEKSAWKQKMLVLSAFLKKASQNRCAVSFVARHARHAMARLCT